MAIASRLLLFSFVLTLAACGGGGGDGDDNNVTEGITVNAGSDLTVDEGDVVNLNGSASGDSSYTFTWSSDNSAVSITQEQTSQATASFVAPETRTENQDIVLTLSATGANGSTAADTVTITVRPVNALPTANISVTQDDRFATNTFPGDYAFTMSAAGSSDADPIDSAAPISAYSWSQTVGTTATSNGATNAASVSYTTPIVASQETLTFEVTVTDNEGATHTSSVDITVLAAQDSLPVVSAGSDLQVMEGERIMLNGSATSIAADATPYTVVWNNSDTSSTVIDQADRLETFSNAPAVSTSTTLQFDLEVTDRFGNTETDSMQVTVLPMPLTLINDTGVVRSVSESAVFTDPVNSFPGQDGEYGRDPVSGNIVLEKVGTGTAGFDFTKLNELGDAVDDDSVVWDCVRDNVTGLVWEVKTNDMGIHDKDYTYTWYSTDTASNGGFDGGIGNGRTCALTTCNTEAFIERVNTDGLCGFFDWRLPTHHELLSIVNYGTSNNVFADSTLFPNTGDYEVVSGETTPLWYWTNVPNADGVQGDAAMSAWAIDFATGNDNFVNKTTTQYIRLVRAGR